MPSRAGAVFPLTGAPAAVDGRPHFQRAYLGPSFSAHHGERESM